MGEVHSLDIIQRTLRMMEMECHVPRAELKSRQIKEMLKVLSSGVSDEKIKIWRKSDRKTTTKLVDELFVFFNGVFSLTTGSTEKYKY